MNKKNNILNQIVRFLVFRLHKSKLFAIFAETIKHKSTIEMTVKELISELEQYPPDAVVMVNKEPSNYTCKMYHAAFLSGFAQGNYQVVGREIYIPRGGRKGDKNLCLMLD